MAFSSGETSTRSAGVPFSARLSTSFKILSIITLALLPLGMIALLASIQSTRTSDLQRRAELRVAATESSRKLGAELASDVAALKEAAGTLGAETSISDLCDRAAAKLSARNGPPAKFALFGTGAIPVCATRGFRPPRPPVALMDASPTARISDNALDVVVPRPVYSAVAVAHYPASTLALFARPVGFGLPYVMRLDTESDSLTLAEPTDPLSFQRETVTEPVGVLSMSLAMTSEGAQFGATEALLTFLPLLMWASAALVGFLVVDRLLIRPLKMLRTAVNAYVPGQKFGFVGDRTPAIEIRELGETFVDFANRLAHREGELATALEHQMRLTREVHHRVKNNLQVIASLISLHARGATGPDAALAYAAIQRRVDALAIVHRHHYAGLGDADGIQLRTLLNELATNLRAGAVANNKTPSISVTTPAFLLGQDSAIPIAFVLTELAEFSMLADPAAPITIDVRQSATPGIACLSIQSVALRGEGAAAHKRIIDGLARQLRSVMTHDPETGRYTVEFHTPVLPEQ